MSQEDEARGVGRPPTVQDAIVQIVNDLYREGGQELAAVEILAEMEARGVGKNRNGRKVALHYARQVGNVQCRKMGRFYLYSPVSGED